MNGSLDRSACTKQDETLLMTKTTSINLGFISSGSPSSPHYSSFTTLLPNDVKIQFEGLHLHQRSLYDLKGKKEIFLSKIKDLVQKNRWDGLIVSGAPSEVLNPGLLTDLKSNIKIPVTTALNACVAALRTYRKNRVLLMTPFDEGMNRLICDYLSNAGITAPAPHPFNQLGEAIRLKPEEVYDLTRKVFGGMQKPEAIYFQGAVLDPLKMLERIETDLDTTVVASNPAMLWFIVSKLGRSYKIPGYGKLLSHWPALSQEVQVASHGC